MPENIVEHLKNFRDKIYNFFHYRRDATIELIDAISSNIAAKSVVELSLNPLHRRNYCSITRVLDEFRKKDQIKNEENTATLTKLLSENCLSNQNRNYHFARVRNNRNFYHPYADRMSHNKRGRKKLYGNVHKLHDPKTWSTPNECFEFELVNKKGHKNTVKIACWNDMLMRSKKECQLKDYPFRLVKAQIHKESSEILFKRPLWG